MREKKKKWTHVAELLSKAAKRMRFEDKIVLGKFADCWPEVVGEGMAKHSRPARWKRKILVIMVEHPAWLQELFYLKHKVVERLRSEFPDSGIKDVKMEIGELPAVFSATRPGERYVGFKEVSGEEKEFIEQAAVEIRDPDVREAARRAMMRGFGRRTSV